MNRRVLKWIVTTAVLALLAAPSVMEAQYFGRNKVQYQSFDFEILETEHFDIYYYAEEEPAIEFVALMAERWYARLSRLLDYELTNRQPLIVYASAPQFRQTNTLQGDIGEATGGVTEILKRRIVLPLAGPLAETDHVLGHELVHAFQFDITGESGGIAMAGVPTVMRYPLWFTEGMAEYLSVGTTDANTAMWMRDAARSALPDIAKLSDPRFFPYRYGQALWAYIAGRYGDGVVGRILKASRMAANPAMAIAQVLRENPDTLVADWHRATREHFASIRQQTGDPSDYGRLLIGPSLDNGGNVNVAPSISPDGSRVVFVSEKSMLAIEMYIADVATGEVIHKVTRNDVDPHFESIQFIYSSGTWNTQSDRFLFAAVNGGRPMLSILNAENGKIEREIKLEEIGEVLNPTWSPDGAHVAFSANVGGLSDLFVIDLDTEEITRLTNDGYADLQPAWSPDGEWIAFSTDRFTTGLTSILHGNYQLARIRPDGGDIIPIAGFTQGKHINPQWSEDSESLYFLSDPYGIPNIYRVELASGQLSQLTNLYTGVSGISTLSPALTVATASGEMAISVYDSDIHQVWLLESPDVLAGGPVLPPFEDVDPATLPPVDRLTNEVTALLDNPFYGLPDDGAVSTFGTKDYKPGLSLDYIAQPSLAVGVDRYGTFVAGGASLFWSDMLGGHNLVTALQVNGGVKDIGALVSYQNLNSRFNWAVTVQQTPIRFTSVLITEGQVNGQSVITENLITQRQTARQLGGTVAYPLNKSQRIEVSGGFLNIDYDSEVRMRSFTDDGFQIEDVTQQLPTAPGLSLGTASLAMVYDASFWGWTSPVLGLRYRLEVGTMIGSIDMYNVLVDFRKYLMPVRPFTLAFRVQHAGRYGPDADRADQIQPQFLGWDGVVRGYSSGSFDFAVECESVNECTSYNELFGSSTIVANVELRFPPLALLGGNSGLFGFLPLEAVVFGDAGIAYWGTANAPLLYSTPNDARPWFMGGDRKMLYSAGAGIRMNVFGIFIMELDYVYPFSRNRGGHLQFGFTPGF